MSEDKIFLRVQHDEQVLTIEGSRQLLRWFMGLSPDEVEGLSALQADPLPFTYPPLDISQRALDQAAQARLRWHGGRVVEPLEAARPADAD